MKTLIKSIELEALEKKYSGVISIFKKNTEIYNRAYGYRDIKNKIPNTIHTRFGIASGTKIFTALGIGKLIDYGMITLKTKMKDIDKKFKIFIDENATILNLLTHTSGIYDYYDEEVIDDYDNYFVNVPWYQLETPSDYYPLFENKTMKNKTNMKYLYSNGGFIFLGMIIEKISGITYRDFICENIFDAAHMINSGFYAFNDLPENTANGYKKDRSTTNIYNLPIRGGGDGGMYTTSEDLRSFWNRLFSSKILSKNLTKQFLETYHKFNEKNGYGCGVYKKLDDSMYYISGSDAGVGFSSRYIPSQNMTINIMSNLTDGNEEIINTVLAFLKC
ncbi:MAG: beta-lactamase family protein [Candidatus Cloacimonetes bacterium]|nr:beta-lactamase family protein [Candidatus Cloacimonadota bacterium]